MHIFLFIESVLVTKSSVRFLHTTFRHLNFISKCLNFPISVLIIRSTNLGYREIMEAKLVQVLPFVKTEMTQLCRANAAKELNLGLKLGEHLKIDEVGVKNKVRHFYFPKLGHMKTKI